MQDYRHRTDTLNSVKVVVVGKQKKHWVEFQLLDEQGEPLANMPYKASNEATRENVVPLFTGQSNAEGIIRLEGLHPLAVTLHIEVDPFACELQRRRLRAERPEPSRPVIGEQMPLYGPQRPGFSPLEKKARDEGHDYHYLRIGQLCDGLPELETPLEAPYLPPSFHFPDVGYGGFTIEYEQLNRRHVLEVCPFRAWSLVLQHQKQYNLANAYNLGLMSILSYSNDEAGQFGAVDEFFLRQCVDLSRTPVVVDGGRNWPCLVMDVPFDDRYTTIRPLNTAKSKTPQGDTQLFYAISAVQVLIAWRGTEMKGSAEDLITDLTFRPVDPVTKNECQLAVPCNEITSAGRVHMGFRDAFEQANFLFSNELLDAIPRSAIDRELYICGHSLGGALGLLQSAALLKLSPVLYTYGMPRTFTLKAVQSLSELTHFRHVNDNDIVPRVPPEVDLDNHFYDVYGPMGTWMGLAWSFRQMMLGVLHDFGDPFSHHGEIALLFKAEQYMTFPGPVYPAYRNPKGEPYQTTISRTLQHKARLYVVPSLCDESSQASEQAQKNFCASWDDTSREKFFPKYGTTPVRKMPSIFSHFMTGYQDQIHNQLLEAIHPERMFRRITVREQFEQQMEEHASRIHEEDLTRNRLFLRLQNKLNSTLHSTWRIEGGQEALQRFDKRAKVEIEVLNA